MQLPVTLIAGWLAVACAAAPPKDARPLRSIGFLVLPGVYNSELMAPYDVLQHLKFHVEGAPEIFTVAPDAGPLKTFEGLELVPHYSFADVPPIDLLVIPSAENNMTSDLEDERLMSWIRDKGTSARLLLSLCDGAFLFAGAGLLDGLEATTFPGDQDRFEKAFPSVELKRDVLWVHDGKAVTGVGGARSYEPAMYIVEKLYGAEAARNIGRGLVIDWDVTSHEHRVGPRATLP
jgi:transcriptional regulator GlxA family with amidase domain